MTKSCFFFLSAGFIILEKCHAHIFATSRQRNSKFFNTTCFTLLAKVSPFFNGGWCFKNSTTWVQCNEGKTKFLQPPTPQNSEAFFVLCNFNSVNFFVQSSIFCLRFGFFWLLQKLHDKHLFLSHFRLWLQSCSFSIDFFFR